MKELSYVRSRDLDISYTFVKCPNKSVQSNSFPSLSLLPFLVVENAVKILLNDFPCLVRINSRLEMA